MINSQLQELTIADAFYSEKFGVMFSSGMKETSQKTIEIKNIRYLAYIYDIATIKIKVILYFQQFVSFFTLVTLNLV